MKHAHIHAEGASSPASDRARRLLTALVIPLGLLTIVGLVVLWPGEVRDLSAELGTPDDLVDARVVEAVRGPCPGTTADAGIRCVTPTVELLDGPDAGQTVQMREQSEMPDAVVIEVGEKIVLSYLADAEPRDRYGFADLEREKPLLVLGALFVVAVLLLGRLQGLRALVGLAISLIVLVGFILPALLEGQNPLAVTLTGSALIAFVSLYLAHGLNARTTTALLGTLSSLTLVGVLGAVFVTAARFTGQADEEALFLTIAAGDLDLRGLLLGGLVIGALGVLDDVTVTQASAVWELHEANPRYRRIDLYRSALRIGRDHIASTVNTLVLAYAGASLPLFLIFLQGNVGLFDAIKGETVAVTVVATLCGSIGLVAAVPLTTALAALVVVGPSPAPTDGPEAAPADDDRPDDTGPEPTPEPAGQEPAAHVGDAEPPAAPPRRPKRQRSTDPKAFRSRKERDFWDE